MEVALLSVRAARKTLRRCRRDLSGSPKETATAGLVVCIVAVRLGSRSLSISLIYKNIAPTMFCYSTTFFCLMESGALLKSDPSVKMSVLSSVT